MYIYNNKGNKFKRGQLFELECTKNDWCIIKDIKTKELNVVKKDEFENEFEELLVNIEKIIEINHGDKFTKIQEEVLNNTYNTMLWDKLNIRRDIDAFNKIVEDDYDLESFIDTINYEMDYNNYGWEGAFCDLFEAILNKDKFKLKNILKTLDDYCNDNNIGKINTKYIDEILNDWNVEVIKFENGSKITTIPNNTCDRGVRSPIKEYGNIAKINNPLIEEESNDISNFCINNLNFNEDLIIYNDIIKSCKNKKEFKKIVSNKLIFFSDDFKKVYHAIINDDEERLKNSIKYIQGMCDVLGLHVENYFNLEEE